jgi:hypothetical protein
MQCNRMMTAAGFAWGFCSSAGATPPPSVNQTLDQHAGFSCSIGGKIVPGFFAIFLIDAISTALSAIDAVPGGGSLDPSLSFAPDLAASGLLSSEIFVVAYSASSPSIDPFIPNAPSLNGLTSTREPSTLLQVFLGLMLAAFVALCDRLITISQGTENLPPFRWFSRLLRVVSHRMVGLNHSSSGFGRPIPIRSRVRSFELWQSEIDGRDRGNNTRDKLRTILETRATDAKIRNEKISNIVRRALGLLLSQHRDSATKPGRP